jgi:type II secretory pathway pseudopilin PulG
MYLVETDRNRVYISDIQVLVTREKPAWVTLKAFESSVLAKELQRKGHLKASKRARSRMSKTKSHAVRMSRPTKQQVRPAKAPEDPTITASQLKALLEENTRKQKEQGAKLAQKAAQQAAQQAVASLLPTLQNLIESHQTPQADLPDIQAQVESAMSKVLSGLTLGQPVSSPAGTPGIDFEEPLFIPTGIVNTGSPTPEIKVSSESSDQAGLGDAAAALKKIRQNKRKK